MEKSNSLKMCSLKIKKKKKTLQKNIESDTFTPESFLQVKVSLMTDSNLEPGLGEINDTLCVKTI